MINMSKRQAERKALELLTAARTLAELANGLVDEYELHNLDFDVSQSGGVTEISWYNSSESC